ncbi:MAG: hypothetical protein WD361_13965 [Gracilimonas sp.]
MKLVKILSVIFFVAIQSANLFSQRIEIISEEVLIDNLPLNIKFSFVNEDSIFISPNQFDNQSDYSLERYTNAGLLELTHTHEKAGSERIINNRYQVYLAKNNKLIVNDLKKKNHKVIDISVSLPIRIWDLNEATNSIVISQQNEKGEKELLSLDLQNGKSKFIDIGVGGEWNSQGEKLIFRGLSEENIHPGIRFRNGDIDEQEYEHLMKQGAPPAIWKISNQNFSYKLDISEFTSANRVLWSPDGEYLIVSDLKKGEYILEIGEENNRPVILNKKKILDPGIEVNYPIWSPDSKYVVYCLYELDERGNSYISTEITLFDHNAQKQRIYINNDIIISDLIWNEPNAIIAVKQNHQDDIKQIIKFNIK